MFQFPTRWFLARWLFYSEDGGDNLVRNVASHKIYIAPHPRRRHSSPPSKVCTILSNVVSVYICIEAYIYMPIYNKVQLPPCLTAWPWYSSQCSCRHVEEQGNVLEMVQRNPPSSTRILFFPSRCFTNKCMAKIAWWQLAPISPTACTKPRPTPKGQCHACRTLSLVSY
jgi:hypothetical protein